MESKPKPKSYIIAMLGARILSTDSREKAEKKIIELVRQELGTFSFTDNLAGTITSYEKDQYQKNYRTTTNPIPAE